MPTRLTPYFAAEQARALLNSANEAVSGMVEWMTEIDQRVTVLESDPVAPTNTALPAISGDAYPGETITCSGGSWFAVPAASLTYQWKNGGVAISGATSNSLLLSDNEIGDSITCTVTATNSEGSADATSAAVVVESQYEAPANISVPVLTGNAYAGNTLTCTTGSWSGTPTPTYTYQWKAGGSNISGAVNATYEVVETEGVVITCTVTATNTAGSAEATSAGKTVEVAPDNPFDALYDGSFELTTLDTAAVPVQAKPAKSTGLSDVSYTDQNYGTKIFRVTNALPVSSANDGSDTDGADITGARMLRHDYSRRQAFNCDNTRMLIIMNDGTMRLYDAETFEYIKALDGGQSSECIWSATDPDIYYYTSNAIGGRIWWSENVETGAITEVINFNTLGTYPEAQGFWFKGEGCFSADGRYACFMATTYDNGSGTNIIHGLVCYDFVNEEVVGTLDAADFPTPNEYPDHCSISASGNWCVPSWGTGTGGTMAYSRDFSVSKQLIDSGQHSDLGFGPNGEDMFVYADYISGSPDEGYVVAVNIDTLERFRTIPLYYQPSSACAVHISAKAFDKPGWVVLSTYQEMAAASGDLIENKVMLVELVPDGRKYNIAHTQHRHTGTGLEYFLEPQASASRDLTRIIWASDMNTTPTCIEAYMVGLPSWAVPDAEQGLTAPSFSVHPQSASIADGDTVNLSCTATGFPAPTYQWQVNEGSGWGDITGATSNSYISGTLEAADSGIQYRCVATNSEGTATSNVATVTVTAVSAPSFTLHPQNSTVDAGQQAEFTCSADGVPTPTYQWQDNTGSGWNDISGATGTFYQTDSLLEADTGTQYRCVATNSEGSATSDAATVTVEPVVEAGVLDIAAHGIGSYLDTAYPFEIATCTLNTRATGDSGFLVVGLMEANHPGTVSVTDSYSNTYTQLSASDGAGGENRMYMFFSPGGAGGDDHTFTFHGVAAESSYPAVFVMEIVGSGLTVDQFAENLDTSPPLTTPVITPTTDGQAIIAVSGGRTDGALTVNSPFTLINTTTQIDGAAPNGYYGGATAHMIQETAAPVSATFVQAGNTYSLGQIVSIKAP